MRFGRVADNPGVDSMLNQMQLKPASPFSCRVPAIFLVATLLPSAAFGQQLARHQQILELVDQHAAHFSGISKTIWQYAELGYQEEKSSTLLQRELQAVGFRVQSSIAEEPTAFIATYGNGEPVIGILGEFDALPGLSMANYKIA
jgi:aminobenzoyl-glutamate utilization protein B